MVRAINVLLAVGLAANGLFMLAAPTSWYEVVPGVSATGPFNPHFVRDIGCAFLVAGAGFAWNAIDRRRGWPAALAGAVFLSFHALVHLWDLLAGREHAHHFAGDLPLIFFPAVLALWVARPPKEDDARKASRPRASGGRGLVARLVEPKLAAFEREWGYDTSYLRHIARTSGPGFFRFFLFSVFAQHREETPADAWFAAKLAAVIREDCGPCTQLVVRMAEQNAVPAPTLRALMIGDEQAMSADAALAFAFTNAVLDRDVAQTERLQAEVVARWSERSLVTLAFAIAGARVYPTLKYALGYGKACSRVKIGDSDMPVVALSVARPAK